MSLDQLRQARALAQWSGEPALLELFQQHRLLASQPRQLALRQPPAQAQPQPQQLLELSSTDLEKLVFAALLIRQGGVGSAEQALSIADRHWEHQNEWWEQHLARTKPPCPPDSDSLAGVVPPLRPGAKPAGPGSSDAQAPVGEAAADPGQQASGVVGIDALLTRAEAQARQLTLRRDSVQLAHPDLVGRIQVLQGNARAQVVLSAQLLHQFVQQWEPQLKTVSANFSQHARRIHRMREDLLEVHRRVGAIRGLLVERGLLPDRRLADSDDDPDPLPAPLSGNEAGGGMCPKVSLAADLV